MTFFLKYSYILCTCFFKDFEWCTLECILENNQKFCNSSSFNTLKAKHDIIHFSGKIKVVVESYKVEIYFFNIKYHP